MPLFNTGRRNVVAHVVMVLLGVLVGSSNLSAQNAVVQSLMFTDGQYNALLQASGLTSNIVFTLPSAGGMLSTTNSTWQRGGQAVLAGSNRLGSTDVGDLRLITNDSVRIHINGGPGAEEGWIGILSAAPIAPVHIAPQLSMATPGFHGAVRVEARVPSSFATNTFGGAQFTTLTVNGSDDLSNANTLFSNGAIVYYNNTNTSHPNQITGAASAVIMNPTSATGQIAQVSGQISAAILQGESNVSEVSVQRLSVEVRNNSTVSDLALIRTANPTIDGSASVTNAYAIAIDNLVGLPVVQNVRAILYNATSKEHRFAVDSIGRVAAGHDTPNGTLDVDGSVVFRPNELDINIVANQTIDPTGRTFVSVRNVTGSPFDIQLGDGIQSGQLLLLMNTGSSPVILYDSDVNLTLGATERKLFNRSSITLVWHQGSWIETSFTEIP